MQARPDIELIDLRSLAMRGLVESDHLGALAEGKALHQLARPPSLLRQLRRRHPQPSRPAGGATARPAGPLHFPRTDPVVIMLAIAGDECLLGRSHRFQSGMWSCLAGFVEPGETIEEAVRREIREEAGIVCGEVAYFAAQPWPFPMSLMIGCYAQARSRAIVVDRTELDDARWFEREEVAAMLAGRHPDGLTAPLPHAIAHHILRAFVERDIAFA